MSCSYTGAWFHYTCAGVLIDDEGMGRDGRDGFACKEVRGMKKGRKIAEEVAEAVKLSRVLGLEQPQWLRDHLDLQEQKKELEGTKGKGYDIDRKRLRSWDLAVRPLPRPSGALLDALRLVGMRGSHRIEGRMEAAAAGQGTRKRAKPSQPRPVVVVGFDDKSNCHTVWLEDGDGGFEVCGNLTAESSKFSKISKGDLKALEQKVRARGAAELEASGRGRGKRDRPAGGTAAAATAGLSSPPTPKKAKSISKMTGGGSGAMAATTGPSSSPRPKGKAKAKSKSKADADAGAEEMLSWGFVKKPRAGLSLEGKNRHAGAKAEALRNVENLQDRLKSALEAAMEAGAFVGEGARQVVNDFAEQAKETMKRAEMKEIDMHEIMKQNLRKANMRDEEDPNAEYLREVLRVSAKKWWKNSWSPRPILTTLFVSPFPSQSMMKVDLLGPQCDAEECSMDLYSLRMFQFTENDAHDTMIPCVVRSLAEHPVPKVRICASELMRLGHGIREAVSKVTDSMWLKYIKERDEGREEIGRAWDEAKLVQVNFRVESLISGSSGGKPEVVEVVKVEMREEEGLWGDPNEGVFTESEAEDMAMEEAVT